MNNIDRQYGELLEQLSTQRMPWPAPPPPQPHLGIGTQEQLMRLDEMLAMGWIDGTPNRGDNHLMSIRDVFVTSIGRAELSRLRRESARSDAKGGNLPESLDEKRAMRAAFMRLLYEETNGSTNATANEKELGLRFGWDDGTTDLVAEYLQGEGLLEYVAFGGTIAITHAGVVEVEQGLRTPGEPTSHFAAFNQINIGTATNVALQQGTTNSAQNVTLINNDQRADVLNLLGEVETIVTTWPRNDPIRVEAETAVEAAKSELAAPATETGRIRNALATVAGVLTKGATLGTSAETLLVLAGKLIHAL